MIKNYIVLLVIVSSAALSAKAQTLIYGSFKIGDQEIVYQKVFTQDSITPGKLETYYATLPYVTNVVPREGGVQFDVTDLTVDFKKFQFKPLDTPPIIQTGRYSGKVLVTVKDGKYRLTYNALEVTGDIGYKKITTRDRLTNYACRNSGTVISPDWCKPNMLGLLEKAFTDKLQYVEKKDEW